jgi:hypothetical protein
VVPLDSHRISRVPWYSGVRSPGHARVGYGPLTLFGACFPAASPTHMLAQVNDRSLQPHIPVAQDGFGLLPFRSPLLRESRLISFPPGTEMFQFPRCPSSGLCIQPAMRTIPRSRVAPFGIRRLIARLQLPVDVSPLSASFFGSWPLRHPPNTPPCLAVLPIAHLHTAHGRPYGCPQVVRSRAYTASMFSVRQNRRVGFQTHNASHHSHAIASLLTQLASAKLQQSLYAFGKVLEETPVLTTGEWETGSQQALLRGERASLKRDPDRRLF